MTFTEEQKHKYIESEEKLCPFCGHDCFLVSSPTIVPSVIWQNLTCEKCGGTWREYYGYKLVSIMDIKKEF